jgi:hypothetical protein
MRKELTKEGHGLSLHFNELDGGLMWAVIAPSIVPETSLEFASKI